MLPELPICSPFANKIPRFKPGLSWNTLPLSSERVYSKVTALTAQPATEEILDVFSADTLTIVFLFALLFVSLPQSLCFFSLSLSFCKKKKTYYCRRWPFLISCLRFHFLTTWCVTQNKNQYVSSEDHACPQVRGFSPSDIVFTVTPQARKIPGLQMEAVMEERGHIASKCSKLWAWMSTTLNYIRVCFSHVSRNESIKSFSVNSDYSRWDSERRTHISKKQQRTAFRFPHQSFYIFHISLEW